MFTQAVDVVMSKNIASIKCLQENLRIGWLRSSAILDQMEAVGIIGPLNEDRPREILMTKRQWKAIEPQCTDELPF